jgi:hypothetical protein
MHTHYQSQTEQCFLSGMNHNTIAQYLLSTTGDGLQVLAQLAGDSDEAVVKLNGLPADRCR